MVTWDTLAVVLLSLSGVAFAGIVLTFLWAAWRSYEKRHTQRVSCPRCQRDQTDGTLPRRFELCDACRVVLTGRLNTEGRAR